MPAALRRRHGLSPTPAAPSGLLAVALAALAGGGALAAPPDVCSATQGITCTGPKLKTAGAPSPAACCALCKATPQCGAWSWDGGSRQCTALKECSSGNAGLGALYSGSSKKLPRAQWPAAGPPVLPLPFRNATLPLAERVAWLVANLSNAEKEGLLGTRTSAVPRLAIRQYNYYVECNSGAYANGARAPFACPAEEKPSGSGNKPSGNTNRAVGSWLQGTTQTPSEARPAPRRTSVRSSLIPLTLCGYAYTVLLLG